SVDLLDCSKESAGVANAKRGGASDADGLVTTRQRGRQCNKTGLIDRERAARRGKREQFVTSYRDSTDRSVAMSCCRISNENREAVRKSGWPFNGQSLDAAVVERVHHQRVRLLVDGHRAGCCRDVLEDANCGRQLRHVDGAARAVSGGWSADA